MSIFPGFIGPSYRSASIFAAVDKCVNWFLEVIEEKVDTKARVVLYPTPCTGTLSYNSPDIDPGTGNYVGKSRGLIQLNGKIYGVNGPFFFQYVTPTAAFPFGEWVVLGMVLDDGNPVSMIANGVVSPENQQLFITSAGEGYVFTTGRLFVHLDRAGTGFEAGVGAAFLDDYFCSIIAGTNGFQVSNINDGLNWRAVTTNIAFTQGQSDALVNLIANQEYLYLFGSRRSEIWYNPGNQLFPFSIQPGAFIEMGLEAPYALIQADNSIFFLGQDMRGGRSAWRLNGITPVRVSNHAIEAEWQLYEDIRDCVLYSFLWRGHIFVRFIFPLAGKGWTYDCTASQQMGEAVWHENTFTDLNGQQHAPLERTHIYFEGVHIVGSGGAEGFPGTLYQFTDNTMVDVDPVLLLRYSNDAGNTWGAERAVPVGKVGEYDKRIIADLLGAGRDRVFWIRGVDYGDAGGSYPILRDRICPHLFNENRRVFYHRLEIEASKGIGFSAGLV